jgi:hypothetical protein
MTAKQRQAFGEALTEAMITAMEEHGSPISLKLAKGLRAGLTKRRMEEAADYADAPGFTRARETRKTPARAYNYNSSGLDEPRICVSKTGDGLDRVKQYRDAVKAAGEANKVRLPRGGRGYNDTGM